jgi:membrane-associated phospholipid phosphatase
MDQTIQSKRITQPERNENVYARTILTLVLLAAAILAIGILAYGAYTTPYFPFDLTITHAVQSFNAPWFDTLMRASGFPGYPPQVYVWLAIVLLLLWFTGRRWEAVALVFCAVGIGAVGMLIKIPVDRMRPSPELVKVANPQLDNGKYSFPAGHVEVFVAIFGYLTYLILQEKERHWWHWLLVSFFLIEIVLIGLSRVYVGEHWTSDVIGAYLVGAIWLWATIRFYEWGKPKWGKVTG